VPQFVPAFAVETHVVKHYVTQKNTAQRSSNNHQTSCDSGIREKCISRDSGAPGSAPGEGMVVMARGSSIVWQERGHGRWCRDGVAGRLVYWRGRRGESGGKQSGVGEFNRNGTTGVLNPRGGNQNTVHVYVRVAIVFAKRFYGREVMNGW